MIRLTDNGLWIGNSADGKNLGVLRVSAILNVAQDLRGTVGWPDVEYMQVGLIDGPGNPLCTYSAAVLALASLLGRRRTLVCCHSGGRSLAVCVMYLETLSRIGWDNRITLLQERVNIELPKPHLAHKAAFEAMNWRVLSKLAGEV